MLSWLASDFFSESPVLLLPVIALVLFFLVFTMMSLRALRMPREQVDALASLPFDSDAARAHQEEVRDV